MITVIKTDKFSKWLDALRDREARYIITTRLQRAEDGNLGDVKSVGDGLSEMRISFGAGYRIYFIQRGKQMIIILAGGDKSSQERDIKQAKKLVGDWR